MVQSPPDQMRAIHFKIRANLLDFIYVQILIHIGRYWTVLDGIKVHWTQSKFYTIELLRSPQSHISKKKVKCFLKVTKIIEN